MLPFCTYPELTPSHGTYVIAWSRTRDELRTFKIDRIQHANLTTERFERSEALDADTLFKHAWGIWYGQELTQIELRFAPNVAKRVKETTWHPSQYTEDLDDGSLYWSIEVSGRLELRSWIRGWGPDVEVLGPLDLRREIAEDLHAAAQLYQEGESD